MDPRVNRYCGPMTTVYQIGVHRTGSISIPQLCLKPRLVLTYRSLHVTCCLEQGRGTGDQGPHCEGAADADGRCLRSTWGFKHLATPRKLPEVPANRSF